MNEYRILVVDDEEDLCEILKFNLENEGYEVDTANSAEDALKMDISTYDLLLLDVMMGEISGFKMANMLKKDKKTARVPIIFITAKDTENDTVTGFNLGADDYISKPFSMNLLKGKIRNILKSKQRLRYYYSNTIDIDTAKMTSNTLDEEFMSKAIQIVEENIDDESFTTDDLAEKLFISRSSLYLKMNSISGEPPANFIRRIRLNKACKLLLEGRYSISEISSKIGFSSPSYFSTSFKKYVGCLPSEYVKNQGKNMEQ